MVIRVVPIRAKAGEGDRMDRTVKVNRDKLLERLKSNRELHKSEFEKSFTAYRSKVARLMLGDSRVLETAATKVQDLARDLPLPEVIFRHLHVPRPQDHAIDYDRAIDRIEWEEDGVVEITEGDFNCYVRNEWDWQKRFRDTYRSVTG